MLTNQRVVFSDNGTLIDLSVSLNSIFTGTSTLAVVAAEDKIYVGSDLPFNHRYLQVSVANTNAASISGVDIWTGSEWAAAVDVIDQTSAGGKTLAQSGYLSWTLDRTKAWGQEATTEGIPALASLKIYDFYWARVSFSANLSVTTAIDYVGHKFATDADLGGYYPDLVQSAVMAAFATGKTDWNSQHLLAAEEIIQDIRRKKIAWSRNQILDWEQFNLAGIHKLAAIVMQSFGDDYKDNRFLALKEYEKAMNLKVFNVDLNQDGRLDEEERHVHTGIVRT